MAITFNFVLFSLELFSFGIFLYFFKENDQVKTFIDKVF